VRNVFGLCAAAASAKLIPIVRVTRHMLFPSGQVKHSIAETRRVERYLFGVGPGDPATIAIAAVLMTAVAAVAAYLPGRRATKVGPIVALRFE
jgi:hypothetical protein